MKPSLGRIVLVQTAHPHNGSPVSPAIINRVWSDGDTAKGEYAMLNVTVLPDCDLPYSQTSIQLFEDEEAGRASGSSVFAWWPARA